MLGTVNETDSALATIVRRSDDSVEAHMAGSTYGLLRVRRSGWRAGPRDPRPGSAFHVGPCADLGHHSQVAVHADVSSGLGEGIALKATTLNGIGVQTTATGGHALNVTGRAVFDRSGKVNFAQGSKCGPMD